MLLIFAGTLFVAVLVSEYFRRSVLSAAVLFLVVGFVTGNGVLEITKVNPEDPSVVLLVAYIVVAVLFTEGMRVGLGELREAWRLPGRALLLGFPLTLLGTALAARWLLDLDWTRAFILGAALSPTDPVFAAAIVGREEIPLRLRRLLNVESGLNDGLALPVLLITLATLVERPAETSVRLGEVALGVCVGIAIPWAAARVRRLSVFSVSARYEPFYALSIGLLVLGVCTAMRANMFLGAFASGITVTSCTPHSSKAFQPFGELTSELLKLMALLVLGTLLSPAILAEIGPRGYIFALLALVVVRPLALLVAMAGSDLGWPERVTAFWFGPKGFSTVVYGLLVLQSGVPGANRLFHLTAVVVALSIIAHSSTDVPIAKRFRRRRARNARHEHPEAETAGP